MARPDCSTCAAFNAMTRECRRHAPSPIAQPVGNELRIVGVYPGTSEAQWCAE